MLRDQGMDCREVVPHVKGYRHRMVPLTESSLKIIKHAHALQERMGISSEFIFSQDGNPLPYRASGRALTIICRELGIPHRHIHCIRKTVITVLVDSKCFSPAAIATMMGNSVEVILKNYYYNREDLGSLCRNYPSALSGLYAESDLPDEQ